VGCVVLVCGNLEMVLHDIHSKNKIAETFDFKKSILQKLLLLSIHFFVVPFKGLYKQTCDSLILLNNPRKC
jgi:hypothetical protein